ncbi:MAG: hypothetical protein COA71_08515 [SAR86 cluster bacterium]|uniref:Uncharacterized protein n=1 Tax=SAR86 cluster bacterium TaxID=2030880 RepID=A0A2A5CC33_9GAMM|nr:hypothetical protein [Gammaproteobacteria bacterium AH-315-E17]PCJ41081.1 MAG: hypothetical protein COA71_08515 [SAR86 cluster bacterium]
MRMKTFSRYTLILVTMIVSLPSVLAHHSFAMFDSSTELTLEGRVTEFQWTNPHSWLQVEIINADGEAEDWAIEMLSPSVLGRMGWKRNSLARGDEVRVVIHPLHSGAFGGNMVRVINTGTGEEIGGPGR